MPANSSCLSLRPCHFPLSAFNFHPSSFSLPTSCSTFTPITPYPAGLLAFCSPRLRTHAPTPGKGRALAQITLLQKAVGRCWSHSIFSRIRCRNAKCRPSSSILAHAVVQLVSLTSSLGFDYLELRHTPATPHHAVTF